MVVRLPAGTPVRIHDSPVVNADAAHLTGAIYNIVDNAIKYGGDRIDISLEDKGSNAVLIIDDNGHGIASQYQRKIFERFFRVPSGNLHNVKGHGLGLSYSRYIVVAHSGSLTLESRPGHGATFILSIPKHNPHEL
ncbi:MAG: ATP-binding protein [Sphingobacteriales bacterium]|nr:MAG: ATP-binding protein [Sphingobacteriales bacterium]